MEKKNTGVQCDGSQERETSMFHCQTVWKWFGGHILGSEEAREPLPAYDRAHLHSSDATSGALGTGKEHLQPSHARVREESFFR